MLTEREYKQLSLAINAMWGYNLQGEWYIAAKNVNQLLDLYTQKEVLEPVGSSTEDGKRKSPKGT
jgi:hypothetical protein